VGTSRGIVGFAAVSLGIHLAAAGLVGFAGRAPGRPAPVQLPTAKALAGESFEIGEEPEENEPTAAATSVDPTPEAPPEPGDRKKPKEKSRGAGRAGPAGSGKVATNAPPGEHALYGAVGERGVFGLSSAFTMALPQTASPDPAWATIAFGDAGTVDVTLVIDEHGKMVSAELGPGGTPALRSAVQKAVGFIRGRVFVANGARTVLRVSARVSPDTVHDGLHGDAYAISGNAWHEPMGSAFFALPNGRRIDLTIRAR
jgi:hypothetical protein